MRLGIGTYTYMWSIGFAGAAPARPLRAMDLLRRARDLGVGVVQYGPNLALPELPSGELEELLAAAREWGIELEIGTRGLGAEHLRRMIDFTLRCGSRLLRTVPEGRRPEAELIPSLREVEVDFRGAGVRLGIENGLIPATEMAGALQAVGSAWLGVTLDTVNSMAIPEGAREVVQAVAPWTCCLHVKDFVVCRAWHMMGFLVEGRPAGQGQLDVPWVLEQLRARGAECNAIVELWPPEQASLEETIALEQRWAQESVEGLRRWIKE